VKDDGRVLVRFIAEQLSAFVMWNSALQHVTLVFVKP
jgi:hypothetical protein